MASGEDVVADAPVLPGARRQRPPATIELTAREVASEPDAASPVASAEPMAADASASEPAMPQNPGPDPAGAGGGAGEAPVSPPPLDRGRRPRRGSFIAFATAGAGIALLAVGLMWLADTFAPRDSATDELSARIARLDLQMRDVANRPVVAADPKTVADLGPRIDALAEGLRRLDGIEARLARQETGLARQEAAAQAPRPAPASDTALADRLAAAEARLGALAGAVADLRPRIDAVAEKASTPAPSAPPDNAALEALASRVAALEGALKATDEKLSKSAAAGNSDAPVRLALVALELRVAVERGVPFAIELAAAKPLVADKSLLAALEPVAPLGVPTAQALSRELANVAPAMLRAAGAPAHEGGLLDRLQANAERLVRIRPIAEAPGSDPSTVIVRAEVKATRGDLAGALAEIVGLPADVKAPAAGWIRSAEMRLAAVEAAQKFSTGALAGLGKPSP
jgi:hypothetical protein